MGVQGIPESRKREGLDLGEVGWAGTGLQGDVGEGKGAQGDCSAREGGAGGSYCPGMRVQIVPVPWKGVPGVPSVKEKGVTGWRHPGWPGWGPWC